VGNLNFPDFLANQVCRGDTLPPRGVDSEKRKRQYEHVKESELKRGTSEEDAKRIAAATTNKTKGKERNHQ